MSTRIFDHTLRRLREGRTVQEVAADLNRPESEIEAHYQEAKTRGKLCKEHYREVMGKLYSKGVKM